MTTRPYIALTLIIVCLVAGFGDSVFFHIGRERIRESQIRRMARLEGDHTFESIVENDAIHWVEEEREFILDGRMYDVVETRERGGRREFLVIPDHREKELMDRYLAQSGDDPTSTGYRMPEHNPFSGYWIPTASAECSGHVASPVMQDRAKYGQGFPSPPLFPVPVPPPLV